MIPTDLLLGTDQDFEQNEVGDLATVSGNEYIKQRIAMECLDEAHDFIGSPGTATDIEDLIVDIRGELKKLRNEGLITQIGRIRVTEFDESSVTLSIQLASDEIELELP
ncbi:hypothetical protein [Haladaptatus cibarius]|uniref:hypothetical protein n=1 Tax=Haladaptatus cibarius TaxID=453847 RepID=UPI0006791EFC|nr:hypothetical protein [Haladaptatus cibarius]